MFFSKTFNSFVGKYRGGSKNSIIIESEGRGNKHQSKAGFGPGIEINPGNGERIVLTPINGSESYLVSVAGLSENVPPDTLPGERRLFSVDTDGELSAYLKLKNAGVLELNGNDNFAVLYTELLAEFNKLNSKFNSLITAYNGHTHPYVDTPIGAATTSATTSTGTASDADITKVKSEKVLLPDND